MRIGGNDAGDIGVGDRGGRERKQKHFQSNRRWTDSNAGDFGAKEINKNRIDGNLYSIVRLPRVLLASFMSAVTTYL